MNEDFSDNNINIISACLANNSELIARMLTAVIGLRRAPITNRQKIVALSSLVEGLSLKVTGIKCPQTSDDSLFTEWLAHTVTVGGRPCS